jgi:hypothetical protein
MYTVYMDEGPREALFRITASSEGKTPEETADDLRQMFAALVDIYGELEKRVAAIERKLDG